MSVTREQYFIWVRGKSQKESFPSALVLILDISSLPIYSVSLIFRYVSKKALRLSSVFPKGLTQEPQKGWATLHFWKILSQLLSQFKGLLVRVIECLFRLSQPDCGPDHWEQQESREVAHSKHMHNPPWWWAQALPAHVVGTGNSPFCSHVICGLLIRSKLRTHNDWCIPGTSDGMGC